MKKRVFLLLIMFTLAITYLSAQVDSQFRGPNRDGKYPGEKLLKEWPAEGPKLLQTITGLGKGYSSPAVTDDRFYVTGMIDSSGYLFSYDLEGKLLWKKDYGKDWTSRYPGARSTPTVVGDKIYINDSYGKIYCFNKSGEIDWTVDMVNKFGFREIDYGANEAILIDDDNLYCTPGGENVMMAVLNRHTGETISTIKGNGQKSSHCSPIIVNHENKNVLITMTGQAAVGVDLDSQELIFQEEIFNKWGVNPNIPIYKDGYLFLSTFVTGAKVVQIKSNGKTTSVWERRPVDIESEGAIEVDGYIYCGAAKGRAWYCIDMISGNIMYADKQLIKRANASYADGLLYVYNTRGIVSLVKPNPEKLEVISQFKVEEGSMEHISRLVINNGKLYVRHGNCLNIYDISSES